MIPRLRCGMLAATTSTHSTGRSPEKQNSFANWKATLDGTVVFGGSRWGATITQLGPPQFHWSTRSDFDKAGGTFNRASLQLGRKPSF